MSDWNAGSELDERGAPLRPRDEVLTYDELVEHATACAWAEKAAQQIRMVSFDVA